MPAASFSTDADFTLTLGLLGLGVNQISTDLTYGGFGSTVFPWATLCRARRNQWRHKNDPDNVGFLSHI